MLKLLLPTGSLEKPTFEMFEGSNLPVTSLGSRSYQAKIDDPRIAEVRLMRPQEIPIYVGAGLFDLGIAGLDWVLERDCQDKVVQIADLPYSRGSNRPVRIVVAVSNDSPFQRPEDIPAGSKVTTEYVNLTEKYFKSLNIPVKVEFSYGTTEAKVPEIYDVAVELTEKGETLRANNLKIIGEIVVSSTKLIANKASYEDPEKRIAIDELNTLLQGTLEARGKVLIKLNVRKECLDKLISAIPAMKAPTVSQLMTEGTQYYAVESVVEKDGINVLIPELKRLGAEDIIELPISKVVR
jgi:ATP phosphoribosyltransferase